MLDGRGAQFVAQPRQHLFAGCALVAEHPHFDQAMGLEGVIDFLGDRGGQAVASDHHHGVEMVGVRAMRFAFGGSECYACHAGIIGRWPTSIWELFRLKTGSKKVNRAWLHDHINDTYVKQAKKDGYRARAAYKLKEIDEELRLFRPGQVVVDLGSAPGAWSQYLRRRFAPDGAATGQLDGTVIALDSVEMAPIDGITFLLGDFHDESVLQRLETELAGRPVDVVVSDMAPNLSGIESSDAARVADLVELAVDFALKHLRPEGALVCKTFHGSGYSQQAKLFKDSFRVAKAIKPKASRDKSAETFLAGMGLKPKIHPV